MNGINGIQITYAHPVNPVHPVLSSSRGEGRVVFLTTNNTNWTNDGGNAAEETWRRGLFGRHGSVGQGTRLTGMNHLLSSCSSRQSCLPSGATEASVGVGWRRGGDGMNGINGIQIACAHPVNPVHPVFLPRFVNYGGQCHSCCSWLRQGTMPNRDSLDSADNQW